LMLLTDPTMVDSALNIFFLTVNREIEYTET
jgi:hypothetical protein